MRIIFAGTPEFAATALAALIQAGHEVVLVLTQPDRRAGRGMQIHHSAVKQLAIANQIPVYQPERLKDSASHDPITTACQKDGAQLMVVAAYGLILPQAVLDIPPRGCLNIHASLLPRWRGAAPIHRAIEAGDEMTGVTIMQMDAGLDTGAILLTAPVDIAPDETTGSLQEKLATVGGSLLVRALGTLDDLQAIQQPTEGVTYAGKISKTEAHLSWDGSAASLARKIRAFNPFPGSTFILGGETVKVWRAEVVHDSGSSGRQPGTILAADADGIVVNCGSGALRLLELQKPGARRVSSVDYLRSNSLALG